MYEPLKAVFGNYSYYIILLLVVLWVSYLPQVAKELRPSLANSFGKNDYLLGLVSTLIICGICYLSIDCTFRTLSDETNLLSVSQSMFSTKSSFLTTIGYKYYGNLHPMNTEVPTRPLLFPFLTSLFHSLLGYSYQNPFILNFLTLAVFLFSVFLLARRSLSALASVSAQILAVSVPVVTFTALSAGFDFLAAVAVFAALAATSFFISRPSSFRFAFLWMTLLLIAHARYESPILFVVVMGFLLVSGRMKWRFYRDNMWIYLFTPFFVLPIALQRYLQSGNYQNPVGVPPFSFAHLWQNTLSFFTSEFGFNSYLPYNCLLSWTSLLLFIVLAISAIRRRDSIESDQRCFFSIAALVTFSTMLIVLSYYFGRSAHPSSARFFVLPSLLMAFVPVLFHQHFPRLLNDKGLLLFSAVSFFLYQPYASEARFMNSLYLNREFAYERNFIKKLNDDHILIISDRPGQFTAMDYGAVDFSYANSNSTRVLQELSRHLFVSIYAFQKISYANSSPIQDNSLNPEYGLKPLQEIQLSENDFLRISRVKTTSEAQEAWTKTSEQK